MSGSKIFLDLYMKWTIIAVGNRAELVILQAKMRINVSLSFNKLTEYIILGTKYQHNKDRRTENMVKQLRVLAALLEKLGSIPSTKMVAHNHL